MRYEKKADPFYKSAHWRNARAAAMERDHGICQDCMAAKRGGSRLKPADAVIVHHIIPRKERPDLALELSNLVSLCDSCHNKRHPEKGGSPESRSASAPTGVRIIKV